MGIKERWLIDDEDHVLVNGKPGLMKNNQVDSEPAYKEGFDDFKNGLEANAKKLPEKYRVSYIIGYENARNNS